MITNPYKTNKNTGNTSHGSILTSSSNSKFEMSSSQEAIMIRNTDITISRNVRGTDDKTVVSEQKPATIKASPLCRDRKRAKLLTSVSHSSTYKVYDDDGLEVAEDCHLNALLVLWKDTVLLEMGDFSKDHILPVVPYSTSHWWDREYITNTAGRIAENLKTLRTKMMRVVTELEHDEWWLHKIVQEMNNKLGVGSELMKVEESIRVYAGDVALQVLTCRSLAIKLRMTNANIAVLVHKCVQEEINKLTFKPDPEQKSFTFHVAFGNDDEWHLDIDGDYNNDEED